MYTRNAPLMPRFSDELQCTRRALLVMQIVRRFRTVRREWGQAWGRDGVTFGAEPPRASTFSMLRATICAAGGIELVQDHSVLVSVVCERGCDLENRAKSGLGSSVRFRLGHHYFSHPLFYSGLDPRFCRTISIAAKGATPTRS